MNKKNLFAGAILMLCALFMFTGCEELVSTFDNPVSAYLKVNPSSTKIYRGECYQIQYSTISDAKPVFKSADETVATVDENGVITGVMMGTTTISIELPATPYYNAASAEFTVEVDGLLKLTALSKEFALNEEYNLGVTTVSDGAITYTSSDTNVATVDASGNVKAVGYGDATINVHIDATPTFNRTEDVDFAATVRVLDNEQFTAALAAIADNGEGTLLLGKDATFTFTSNVDFENKKLTILGEENNPAIFNTKGTLKIKRGLTIKNVIVNFTSNGNINFATVQQLADPAPKEGGSYFAFEPIIFENLTFNNLNSCLIKGKEYIVFSDIQVNNCIIGMRENCNAGIFNFDKGYPKNIEVKNSTFWSKGAGHLGYLFNGSGKPGDVSSTATTTFTVDHCSMYKIAVNKKANNGGNIRGKDWTYINLTNSILVDFGSSVGDEITGWLFGQNASAANKPNRTYLNNSYFTSGGSVVNGWTDSAKGGDASGTSLASNPNYKDPENGDFTPQGADQIAEKTGDPRWYKTN